MGLGTATIAATLFAGLLGPVAIPGSGSGAGAVCAVLLSLPVWLAWWWLVRPRIGVRGRRG